MIGGGESCFCNCYSFQCKCGFKRKKMMKALCMHWSEKHPFIFFKGYICFFWVLTFGGLEITYVDVYVSHRSSKKKWPYMTLCRRWPCIWYHPCMHACMIWNLGWKEYSNRTSFHNHHHHHYHLLSRSQLINLKILMIACTQLLPDTSPATSKTNTVC